MVVKNVKHFKSMAIPDNVESDKSQPVQMDLVKQSVSNEESFKNMVLTKPTLKRPQTASSMHSTLSNSHDSHLHSIRRMPGTSTFESPQRKIRAACMHRNRACMSEHNPRPRSAPCVKRYHYHKGILLQPSKSNESWIPEDIRRRMLQRDLGVAKQNFEFKEVCIASSIRQAKRAKASPLERCKSKEKYGIESQKNCGLCEMPFLPINLVMRIPMKAVLDIRNVWGHKYDKEGYEKVRVNLRVERAPQCYNETRVCAFCAQLFDEQQGVYRPTYQQKESEKGKMREERSAADNQARSDPLNELEKEREEALELEFNRLEGKCSVDTPTLSEGRRFRSIKK